MSPSPISARDNRANQLNHCRPAYYRSRGFSLDDAQRTARLHKLALDNRASQLNPNNDAYAASRGESQAPTSSHTSQTMPE
jgi:hypothetical protein